MINRRIARRRAGGRRRAGNPGQTETIEYEDEKGKWHTETASGRDRPRHRRQEQPTRLIQALANRLQRLCVSICTWLLAYRHGRTRGFIGGSKRVVAQDLAERGKRARFFLGRRLGERFNGSRSFLDWIGLDRCLRHGWRLNVDDTSGCCRDRGNAQRIIDRPRLCADDGCGPRKIILMRRVGLFWPVGVDIRERSPHPSCD